MMSVAEIYRQIIEDVIRNVKEECISTGEDVDELVLQQIQSSWESKLMQSGVLGGFTETDNNSSYSKYLSVPYSYPPSIDKEFASPRAETTPIVQPSTPSQLPPSPPQSSTPPSQRAPPIPDIISHLKQSSTVTSSSITTPTTSTSTSTTTPTSSSSTNVEKPKHLLGFPRIPPLAAFDGRPQPYMPPPSSSSLWSEDAHPYQIHRVSKPQIQQQQPQQQTQHVQQQTQYVQSTQHMNTNQHTNQQPVYIQNIQQYAQQVSRSNQAAQQHNIQLQQHLENKLRHSNLLQQFSQNIHHTPQQMTPQKQTVEVSSLESPQKKQRTSGQFDGKDDHSINTTDECDASTKERKTEGKNKSQKITVTLTLGGQFDGTGDVTPKIETEGGLLPDEEPLDSDLDDEEEREPETENLVLCQYEKISRVKNKRKCVLKDGIMMLNGRNYLFSKATGECEF